jgi:hypothetical protein
MSKYTHSTICELQQQENCDVNVDLGIVHFVAIHSFFIFDLPSD